MKDCSFGACNGREALIGPRRGRPRGGIITHILSLLGVALVVLPFLAITASATCQVLTVGDYPDINYTTVCALDEGSFGDGTQTFWHQYAAHVSHAVEADPAFDYAYAQADRGTWTYDDGTTQQSRQWSHVGSGAWEGARGVAGGGYQANVDQRDQTAPEDGDGACSGIVGRSTCVGASGWFTVQDVASVGVGAYYQQSGSGGSCTESLDAGVDLLVVYEPVPVESGPCTAEMPWVYDSSAWDALPTLP